MIINLNLNLKTIIRHQVITFSLLKKNKKKLHKLLLLQILHLCTFFPPAFSTRRNIGICNFDYRKINDITHLSTQYP